MTESESTTAFVKQIHFAFSSLRWGLPLLIVVFWGILALVHRDGWKNFAQRKKWTSRILLFVVMLGLAFPTQLAQQWAQAFLPGRITPEKPFLTATAIKLGVYGLVWGHEFMAQLPPEKQEAAKCVEAVSRAEAQKYQNTCGDNRACFENMPAMTRKDIIAKVGESQKTAIPLVSSACKKVDAAKL